jgi:hypothetical protein
LLGESIVPVPHRLRPPPVSPSHIDQLSDLCDTIEDGGDDVSDLLDEWNRYASRSYEAAEFRTYYGSMSKDEFIAGALMPLPQFDDNLTYDELKAVVEAFQHAEIANQAEQAYFLSWLEKNLSGANVSDLLFWPNEWFREHASYFCEKGQFKPASQLSADQILRYAMLKSGRQLPDAPADVPLPLPLPAQ